MSNKQNHKRWRKEFNSLCLERDKNKCVFCNVNNELDVHHITDRHDVPNGGYASSNGITVCQEHHLLCEEWHSSNQTTFHPGYHPNDLYRIINSSYDKAYTDCQKLK
jgi:hypothetical protein